MKTLVMILTVAAFLQSTILPVNLVLIILICRSYLKTDKGNLFLAFAFGLLVGHLNLDPLGLQVMMNLLIVLATETLAKSRLAGHPLLIVPGTIGLLSLNALVNSVVTAQSVQAYPQIVWEGLISLPIFYFLRLWEERFTISKEIKLRV